jgi:hypothetical protein
VPSRRLSDRIRELCAEALATPESTEFALVAEQLRAALREHTERLRKLAAPLRDVSQRRRTDLDFDPAKLLVKCAICGHPIPLEVAKGNEDGDAVHEGCYVVRLKSARTQVLSSAE